jgi:hypothetical protein
MRARIADLLRREGVVADVPTPVGPHRYISLWWESAGDELAFSDGAHSGAGQLNHWCWLEYMRRKPRQNMLATPATPCSIRDRAILDAERVAVSGTTATLGAVDQ